MPELENLLQTAIHLATAAGERTLPYFGTTLDVETKEDESPVTIADREAETLVRHELEKLHPDHGVVGEEFGETSGPSPYRWWIDPIDGTKAFVRGVPLYGTVLGLERDGEMVVGVASFPALGETLSAARGMGARLNGEPTFVSRQASFGRAIVSTTDGGRFRELGREAAWNRVQKAFWVRAGWGDAYGYNLVATGRIEAMIDPIINAWDVSAFPVIIEEAGGWFGSWSGESTIHGGDSLAVNLELRDALLALLNDSSIESDAQVTVQKPDTGRLVP